MERIEAHDLATRLPEILEAVEAGATFELMRDGHAIGRLSAHPGYFVPRGEIVEAFANAPPLDLDQIRAEMDEVIDPSVRDL